MQTWKRENDCQNGPVKHVAGHLSGQEFQRKLGVFGNRIVVESFSDNYIVDRWHMFCETTWLNMLQKFQQQMRTPASNL